MVMVLIVGRVAADHGSKTWDPDSPVGRFRYPNLASYDRPGFGAPKGTARGKRDCF